MVVGMVVDIVADMAEAVVM
jgi:hypothetical protein